jgi:hypothetical protein
MRIIFEQKAKRTSKILGWSSRIMWPTKVLVGILFLLLMHNPVRGIGVILPSSYSVTLAWNASPSTDVANYDVYYGPASGNYTNSILVGNMTSSTISGLAAGVTYYFAVTTYDTNGQESTFSNEINYTPGIPTVSIRAATAGQFVLTVSGAIGQTYEIEATQDFTTWTIIGAVTLGASGSLDFTDTNAASFPQRFYRAVLTTNVLATMRIHSAPAGQFVLTVSGAIGQMYEIEATQDFATWTIIGTVTLGAGGSLDFTDTNAAGFPQRFYRTQKTP